MFDVGFFTDIRYTNIVQPLISNTDINWYWDPPKTKKEIQKLTFQVTTNITYLLSWN